MTTTDTDPYTHAYCPEGSVAKLLTELPEAGRRLDNNLMVTGLRNADHPVIAACGYLPVNYPEGTGTSTTAPTYIYLGDRVEVRFTPLPQDQVDYQTALARWQAQSDKLDHVSAELRAFADDLDRMTVSAMTQRRKVNALFKNLSHIYRILAAATEPPPTPPKTVKAPKAPAKPKKAAKKTIRKKARKKT